MTDADHFEAKKALTFEINPQRRIAYLRYEMNPSVSEWQTVVDQIFSHPDFRPDFGILSDRRGVLDASPELVQGAIEFLAVCKVQGRWTGKWAMVANSSDSANRAKVLENLLHPIHAEYKGFDNINDAENWLASN